MKAEQQMEQQTTQRSLTAGDDHFTEMVAGTATVKHGGPADSDVVSLPGFDHRSASDSEIVRAFHGARKP